MRIDDWIPYSSGMALPSKSIGWIRKGSRRKEDIMRIAKTLCFILVLVVTVFFHQSCAKEDILFSVRKISDRAMVLDLKDAGGTNIVALKSQKGLVVIDTEKSSRIGARLRETISNEFGRPDFIYVINTHHHWDHSNGNYAFRDTRIIGHELCGTGMKEFYAGRKEFADKYNEGWLSYLEKQLTASSPDSEESHVTRERLRYGRGVYQELNEGFTSVPPSITFSDRLTLDLGDMSIELFYLGLCHTESDVLIHVPDEKLLVIGDTFQKNEIAWIDENAAVERWLDIFNPLLDDTKQIASAVPGHGEIMTAEELRTQRDYIQCLWDGIRNLKKEGRTLDEAKEIYSFEKRFSHLKNISHTWSDGTDYHILNIENVWKHF